MEERTGRTLLGHHLPVVLALGWPVGMPSASEAHQLLARLQDAQLDPGSLSKDDLDRVVDQVNGTVDQLRVDREREYEDRQRRAVEAARQRHAKQPAPPARR
jgi:hypothetical protein